MNCAIEQAHAGLTPGSLPRPFLRPMIASTSLALAAGLAACTAEQPNEYIGQVTEVATNLTAFRPGERVEIWVDVLNDSPEDRHYVVAVEIDDPNDSAVWDSHRGSQRRSHEGDDCREVTLASGASTSVGPFLATLPQSAPAGRYHVIAGLRVYPWSGSASFRGATWAPPEELIEVR